MDTALNLMDTKIDIFTYVDGTEDYYQFMQYQAIKYATRPSKLLFHSITRRHNKELTGGGRVGNYFNHNIDIDCHNTRGSMVHGVALNWINKCDKEQKLGDIIIVMDADICLLQKHWDTMVRNNLFDNCCFGFNRPNQNFPSVLFLAFKRPILDIKELDFTPMLDEKDSPIKRVIDSDKEAKYRKQPKGDEIKCDTGWQLPILFKGCGVGLPFTESTSNKCKLPILSKEEAEYSKCSPYHMSEWHYRNQLFGTHKQASRNHRLDSGYGKMWRQKIEAYEKGVK